MITNTDEENADAHHHPYHHDPKFNTGNQSNADTNDTDYELNIIASTK